MEGNDENAETPGSDEQPGSENSEDESPAGADGDSEANPRVAGASEVPESVDPVLTLPVIPVPAPKGDEETPAPTPAVAPAVQPTENEPPKKRVGLFSDVSWKRYGN